MGFILLQLKIDRTAKDAATMVKASKGNNHRESGKDDPGDIYIFIMSVTMTRMHIITTPVHVTAAIAMFTSFRLYLS